MRLDSVFESGNERSLFVWIILTFLSFFPIIGSLPLLALVLYIKIKNIKPRGAVIVSGIICISISLFSFAIMYFADAFDLTMIIGNLVNIICGISILCIYFSINKMHKLNERVFSLVSIDHIISVNRIAEILGVSANKVTSCINSLIKDNRLNGKVDVKAGELILDNCIWEKQLCICNNCGASIVVNFGDTLVCSYCSSTLSVKRYREINK